MGLWLDLGGLRASFMPEKSRSTSSMTAAEQDHGTRAVVYHKAGKGPERARTHQWLIPPPSVDCNQINTLQCRDVADGAAWLAPNLPGFDRIDQRPRQIRCFGEYVCAALKLGFS
jgi:hypothetical protein